MIYLYSLLGLVCPGLGLVCQGYIKHGLALLVSWFVLLVGFCWLRWLDSPTGGVILLSLLTGTLLFSAIAPWLFHRKKSAFSRVKQLGTGSLFLLFFVSMLFGSFFYRATLLGWDIYFVPSSSMEPTLLPGDIMLVDTWVYQQKPAQRGNVVVFKSPIHERIAMVKRIFALEGELVKTDGRTAIITKRETTTHNGFLVDVTAGYLFMLGDNPKESYDSRMLGAIASDRLIGKARWVVYSEDEKRNIRWDRVGERL